MNDTCTCLDVFDILFGIFLGFMFFYVAFRSKIGCVSKNDYQRTRREIKSASRAMNLIFGLPLSTLAILTIYFWYVDYDRAEC